MNGYNLYVVMDSGTRKPDFFLIPKPDSPHSCDKFWEREIGKPYFNQGVTRLFCNPNPLLVVCKNLVLNVECQNTKMLCKYEKLR